MLRLSSWLTHSPELVAGIEARGARARAELTALKLDEPERGLGLELLAAGSRAAYEQLSHLEPAEAERAMESLEALADSLPEALVARQASRRAIEAWSGRRVAAEEVLGDQPLPAKPLEEASASLSNLDASLRAVDPRRVDYAELGAYINRHETGDARRLLDLATGKARSQLIAAEKYARAALAFPLDDDQRESATSIIERAADLTGAAVTARQDIESLSECLRSLLGDEDRSRAIELELESADEVLEKGDLAGYAEALSRAGRKNSELGAACAARSTLLDWWSELRAALHGVYPLSNTKLAKLQPELDEADELVGTGEVAMGLARYQEAEAALLEGLSVGLEDWLGLQESVWVAAWGR